MFLKEGRSQPFQVWTAKSTETEETREAVMSVVEATVQVLG